MSALSVAEAREALKQAEVADGTARREQARQVAIELSLQCRKARDEVRALERQFRSVQGEVASYGAACADTERAQQEISAWLEGLEFPTADEQAEANTERSKLQRKLDRQRKARLDAQYRVGELQNEVLAADQRYVGLQYQYRNARAIAAGERLGKFEGGISRI